MEKTASPSLFPDGGNTRTGLVVPKGAPQCLTKSKVGLHQEGYNLLGLNTANVDPKGNPNNAFVISAIVICPESHTNRPTI